MTKTEAKRTIPAFMIPAQCRIVKRGDIMVAMNTSRAEMPVQASFDGGETWQATAFQTANFRHNLDQSTLREVVKWFESADA